MYRKRTNLKDNMNGHTGGLGPHEVKPDITHIHNMMAQQQAVAMSQQGYFGFPMSTSSSPSPGAMHSPVSSIGSPGILIFTCRNDCVSRDN